MMFDVVVSVILLFIAVAMLVTIHLCIVGGAFRGGGFDINAANNVVQRSRSTNPNMSLDDIKRLPSFNYKVEEEKEKVIDPMECAVCLENFKVGEICRLLPNCKHSFHAQCIDSWLSKTAICPVCRSNANFTNIGEQSRNSSEVEVELV